MAGEKREIIRFVGTGLFFVGIVVLAYETIAFWLVQSLPPTEVRVAGNQVYM